MDAAGEKDVQGASERAYAGVCPCALMMFICDFFPYHLPFDNFVMHAQRKESVTRGACLFWTDSDSTRHTLTHRHNTSFNWTCMRRTVRVPKSGLSSFLFYRPLLNLCWRCSFLCVVHTPGTHSHSLDLLAHWILSWFMPLALKKTVWSHFGAVYYLINTHTC